MELDLTEILAHVGMHRACEIAEPPIEDGELVCVQPITGSIGFTNSGSALILEGHVTTRVALSCSRCLAPMEAAIAAVVSEQFPLVRHSGPYTRGSIAMVQEDDAPMAGGLFTGPLMNLTELLRQILLLELPSHPLHREDCLGLCPRCGHDLNEGPCDCPVADALGPVGGLATLLEPGRLSSHEL